MLYYHISPVNELPDNPQNFGGNNFTIGIIEEWNKLPKIIQKKLPSMHTDMAADYESSKELQMAQIQCIHYKILNQKGMITLCHIIKNNHGRFCTSLIIQIFAIIALFTRVTANHITCNWLSKMHDILTQLNSIILSKCDLSMYGLHAVLV